MQKRDRSGTHDIKRWVLLSPEPSGKWQSVRRKLELTGSCEAPELTYPEITFSDHFGSFQNLELAIRGARLVRLDVQDVGLEKARDFRRRMLSLRRQKTLTYRET